jgi:hypothetical protein
MPVILREEHKVGMFENKMPKKIKRAETGGYCVVTY